MERGGGNCEEKKTSCHGGCKGICSRRGKKIRKEKLCRDHGPGACTDRRGKEKRKLQAQGTGLKPEGRCVGGGGNFWNQRGHGEPGRGGAAHSGVGG